MAEKFEDKFPEGRIDPHDEGVLDIAMGLLPDGKTFVVQFKKPVRWFSMPKEQAIDFARNILRRCVEGVITAESDDSPIEPGSLPMSKFTHELVVDPKRMKLKQTGINVRALGPDGKPGSYDIVQLDGPSALTWLRSRGGKNQWAEMTVLALLGHDLSDGKIEARKRKMDA